MKQEPVNIQVNFNPAFLPFFEDKRFYKILYGSAGSGKSYSAAQKIVKRCVEERGHRVWCFRKVSTYVDASVYDAIKSVISDFGITEMVVFNKTNKMITFPYSDSVIRCAGLDDEEKIKSITKITIGWLEETTEFNQQDVTQLGLRMRGEFDYYRELIMTFNPVSELHWIKDKFFDNASDSLKSKLFTLHTTYKDNNFLGAEYVQRLEDDHIHDPNNYRIYVKGEWGKVITGMEYYKNFSYDYHIKKNELDPDIPVHITFDFNVVPYITASIWQIKGYKKNEFPDYIDEKYKKNWEKIYFVRGLKEIALRHPKNSTEDICYEILEEYEQYAQCGIVLYGDATGRNRKTSSKKTDWMIIEDILKQYIIDVRVPRSNPLPEEKHTFINRMFFGSFPIVCEIHPDMKKLIEDLTHSLEDGERRKIKSRARDPISKIIVEKFGHFTDGLDYLFCEAFKEFM